MRSEKPEVRSHWALGLLVRPQCTLALLPNSLDCPFVGAQPEATIHPGALESILELLRHASRHMQVVITTHSPELLDAKWIMDRHLRIVEWTEGATRVAPVSDATRKALHDHLMGAGELLRSNALEPAPLFDDPARLMQGNLFEDFS